MSEQPAAPTPSPAPWVKNYQPGVPAEIKLPTTPLTVMFERSVAEAGDRPALQFFGRRTTYAELGDQVARAAEGLRRLGVRHGDRVALILPNCPQHVVAYYAVLRLGAIVVEHNPLYTSRELRHQFESHRAHVVIAWDKTVAAIRAFPSDVAPDHIVSVNLLEAFPTVKRLALNLPVPSLRRTKASLTAPAPGTIPWAKLLDNRPLDPAHPHPDVTDLAAIQYTSGTTGRPKGAMLTHRNLHSNALQGEAWMYGAEYRKEVFYAILPMFHGFGMTLYLTYGLLKQALVVLFPKFDVDMVLDAMKTTPATVYCAVPPIYERTAMAAKERGISLRSCKYCISGAMNLPNHVVELWESVSGGLLVEGYGLTEASPVALGNPFHPSRRAAPVARSAVEAEGSGVRAGATGEGSHHLPERHRRDAEQDRTVPPHDELTTTAHRLPEVEAIDLGQVAGVGVGIIGRAAQQPTCDLSAPTAIVIVAHERNDARSGQASAVRRLRTALAHTRCAANGRSIRPSTCQDPGSATGMTRTPASGSVSDAPNRYLTSRSVSTTLSPQTARPMSPILAGPPDQK